MKLEDLGWNAFFQRAFAPYEGPGYCVGRVARQHKHWYQAITENGLVWAGISGKLRYLAAGRQDLPTVGDWVVLRAGPAQGKAAIDGLLPRKSQFSRKMPGSATEEQVVAANIDTVFLVMGLDQDFNLRRLERYLLLAWESGTAPVLVLNKADLCRAVDQRIGEVESAAATVPIRVVSAALNAGLETLAPYLIRGQTVALLGSSGVGKSTLINRWLGCDRQRVQEVRAKDGRGRHTTTARALMVLPSRGLVVDTPGLRELQLWVSEGGLQETFVAIELLAGQCRFRNCRHEVEPGCAVSEALSEGTLDAERLGSYRNCKRNSGAWL